MHGEPSAPRQPRLDLGLLVRSVIVRKQMNSHVLGRFAPKVLEKAQPLHVRVLPLGEVDQSPV